MNNDISFIELTLPENLEQITIDPRLKGIFTGVMYRIQEYFNRRGYTKNFDYATFLQKYLINAGYLYKMRFKVTRKSKSGNRSFAGYYNASKSSIMISKKYLNDPESEKIFCHEFIHFLTKHLLFFEGKMMNEKNKEIFNGGFINEALTEMLTLEIYPEFKTTSSYKPHVKMLEFVNKMCHSINLYQSFLLGYVDINVVKGLKRTDDIIRYEKDFYHFVSKYHHNNLTYSMEDALVSMDYLNGQRSIILAVLTSINTFEDYFEFLKNLVDAPVPDPEYLETSLSNKERELVSKVVPVNSNDGQYLLSSLRKLRNNIMVYNEKLFALPFDGGTISFYDVNDWVLYLGDVPSKKRKIVQGVYRSFKDGVYVFEYIVNNVRYYRTIDKVAEYHRLQESYEKFKKDLYYLSRNFTISTTFMYDYPLENQRVEFVGRRRK